MSIKPIDNASLMQTLCHDVLSEQKKPNITFGFLKFEKLYFFNTV